MQLKQLKTIILSFILVLLVLMPPFVSIGSPLDPPPDDEAYHYWYAPENSFGISEMKTVNWSHFQALFNEHFYKKALYKRYSYSEWIDGTQYLTLNKTWNESGFWKVDVILDIPVDLYSVNISFGCDLPVLNYVEREEESYGVWLNYSANATETYNIFFNWSDIAQIPNLEISKHRTDGKFWVSFKKDNVVAGLYSFDPSFGYSGDASGDAVLFEDKKVGTVASPSSSGTVDEICAYIKINNGIAHKFGIYNNDTRDYVGTTVEGTGTYDDYTWVTLAIDGSVSITGSVNYALYAFGDSNPGQSAIRMSDTGWWMYKSDQTYPTWENPDTAVPTFNYGNAMIYANYTVTPTATGYPDGYFYFETEAPHENCLAVAYDEIWHYYTMS